MKPRIVLGQMMKQILSIGFATLLLFASTQVQAGSVSGTYYEDSASSVCDANNCRITFSPTPSSGFVTFENINCGISAADTTSIFSSVILTLNGTRIIWLPNQYITTQYQTIVEFNIPIKFKVGSGRTISVLAAATKSTNIHLNCTVTGTVSPN